MGNYTGRSGLKTGTAGDDFETEHETHGITVESGTGKESSGGTIRLENIASEEPTDVGMGRLLGHARDETPAGFDFFALGGNESTLRLSNQAFSSKNIEVFVTGDKISNEGIRPDYIISGNTLIFTDYVLLDGQSDGVTDNGDTLLNENGRGIVLEDVFCSPAGESVIVADGLSVSILVPPRLLELADNTPGTSTTSVTRRRDTVLTGLNPDGSTSIITSSDVEGDDIASSCILVENQNESFTISFAEKFGVSNVSTFVDGAGNKFNTLLNAPGHDLKAGDTMTVSGISFSSVDPNGDFIVQATTTSQIRYQIGTGGGTAELYGVGIVGSVRRSGPTNKIGLEQVGVLVKYT